MQTTTIRPGLLVSLKSSVTGNVHYERSTLETAHITEEGTQKSAWETERTISDPIEYDAAIKLRSRCRTIINSVCTASTFGLLCPETKTEEFSAAVDEALRLASAFNATAKLTRVSVFVIAGRIAADDLQAVRAINSEVRDLLSEIETGLEKLDVERIRAAAQRTRNLGQMLSPAAAERVQVAIDAARSAARKIVKAGETASIVIDEATLRAVRDSRVAFLDLDEAGDVAAPAAAARAVDLGAFDDWGPVTITGADPAPRQIEL